MKTNSKQELALALFIAVEITLFGITGKNFFTLANFFECIRLSVEIGLLALALTPVIVTGGIDLSVGSMMGLCAVSFGALWRDAHLPLSVAIALTLLVSLAGGAVNAVLVARLNASPLIVTLGTYSLFRGLAEAITRGAENYSGFPSGFLYIGQGYLGGSVPTQTIFLVVAAIGFWLLLQRTVIGRGLYAIGHSADAARYAAVPVARRLALVYVLCGFAAGVAAITYVAHLGQAKSDAGTGYELIAITAVVLGGTSIFGGSGTIAGTLLGLAAIVILQNGLRLSEWPAELADILTGVLLVATIALEQLLSRAKLGRAQEFSFRRGSRRQRLAALYGAVVAVLLLVVLSKGYFRETSSKPTSRRSITIGVMPKAKGDPYFISCRAGAEAAARDLNVTMIWDGPSGLDAAKQNEVVEGWITRHVDAISVSVENGLGISSVLRKARAQGIKVVTWDADAEPDARDLFLNQATPNRSATRWWMRRRESWGTKDNSLSSREL